MSMVRRVGTVGVLTAVVIGAVVSMAGTADAQSQRPHGQGRTEQVAPVSYQRQHKGTSAQRVMDRGNWAAGNHRTDGWKEDGPCGCE